MNMIARDENWINLMVIKNLIKLGLGGEDKLFILKVSSLKPNDECRFDCRFRLREASQIKASLFLLNSIAFS